MPDLESAYLAGVAAERARCAAIARTWQERPGVQVGHNDDGTRCAIFGCLAACGEGLVCTAPEGIAAAIEAEGR